MYDGVLTLILPRGAQIILFADDMALVIRGKYVEELMRTCNYGK